MHMKRFIALSLLLIIAKVGNSCCGISSSFVNKLTGKETIIKVRIIEHLELPKSLIENELVRLNQIQYDLEMESGKFKSPFPPPPPRPLQVDIYGYTKLVVEEIYYGEMKRDTIGFYNERHNGICIEHHPIGSKLILKLWDIKIDDRLQNFEKLKTLHPFIYDYPMYASGMCGNNILTMKINKIVGFISSNEKYDLHAKAVFDESLTKSERYAIIKQMNEVEPEIFSEEEFKKALYIGLSRIKKE